MQWLKLTLKTFGDWLFGKFGYFRPEVNHNILNNLYANYQNECFTTQGLLDSVSWLTQRHNDNNLMITALTLMQAAGGNEITLQKEYLKDIVDRRLETLFRIEEDGNWTCVVQEVPQPKQEDDEFAELDVEIEE